MSNNTRCYKIRAPDNSPPLIQNGNAVFQAHQVGWIVSGFLTLIAIITSFWLIGKHLQWYTNKREQRYVVRILFMVPIYAIISFASYILWNYATPLLLIRDCYESTVLTAFFYLLLMYISPDSDQQKDVFRKEGLSREYDREARRRGTPERKWVFPLGSVKWKPADGLYFLQLMKYGILQYCVIRPLTTLAAVILDYMGLYCDDSYSPKWGHIYITAIVSISVTVAMYCLLQLYIAVSEELAPYKPLLKLFSVKAVVFLTFWQSTLLSALTMFGFVKDTKYMTADDINNGIAAILETFEMMCFAFLHIRAFTYRVYKPHYNPSSPYAPPPERTPRLRSLAHAMDFRETFREIWDGCVYMCNRARGKETDVTAKRAAIMEEVFERSRFPNRAHGVDSGMGVRQEKYAKGLQVEVEEIVVVGDERQWLGDGYGYGVRREKSEGLEEQIERELQRRGYSVRNEPPREHFDRHFTTVEQGHERGKRSWWRSMYERVSQSGPDRDDSRLSPPPSRRSRSRQQSESRQASRDMDSRPLMAYDDAPPPSAIRSYRSSHHRRVIAGLDGITSQPETTSTAAVLGPSPPLSDVADGRSRWEPDTTGPVSPPISRSDSLLGRLFPDNSRSEVSSVNARSATVPSSQSHQSQGLPSNIAVVVTKEADVRRLPLVVQRDADIRDTVQLVPVSPMSLGNSAQFPSRQFSVYPKTLPQQPDGVRESVQHLSSGSRPSPLASRTFFPNPQSDSESANPGGPPPSHRPRPNQIVLPAPLSPVAGNVGSPPGLGRHLAAVQEDSSYYGPGSNTSMLPSSFPDNNNSNRAYGREAAFDSSLSDRTFSNQRGAVAASDHSPRSPKRRPHTRRFSSPRQPPPSRSRRTSAPPNSLQAIPQDTAMGPQIGADRPGHRYSLDSGYDNRLVGGHAPSAPPTRSASPTSPSIPIQAHPHHAGEAFFAPSSPTRLLDEFEHSRYPAMNRVLSPTRGSPSPRHSRPPTTRGRPIINSLQPYSQDSGYSRRYDAGYGPR